MLSYNTYPIPGLPPFWHFHLKETKKGNLIGKTCQNLVIKRKGSILMETTNNVELVEDFRRVPLSLAGAKGPDKLSTTEQGEQGKVCQYSLRTLGE